MSLMENREQAILKKGICSLMLVLGINSLINFVYCYLTDLVFGEYINFFLVCVHLLGLFIVRKYSYNDLKTLMPVYITILLIIIFPEMIVSFRKAQLTGILWLVPSAPLGLTIFFPNRAGIVWTAIVLVFVILTFLLEPLIPGLLLTDFMMPTAQQRMINFFTITTGFTCSFVPLYTKFKLLSMKNEKPVAVVDKEGTVKNTDADGNLKENDKFGIIYNEIVKCFEEKKLYRDPNLTISKLAETLGTNTNYIYQAIQQNKQMNFNTFVNQYRVNMVKTLIADGWDKKYTIQHIYTFAGFQHQTTFNKVFKSLEGMNPSDYIALQKV